MDLASLEGLEGLSIGRLAQALGMSKSGVIGHFASKQALQLETVEAARALFETRVLEPVSTESGLARLRDLVESWIAYVESGAFSGGCFFWAASAEFDGRPGPVRERIASLTAHWLDELARESGRAVERGELAPATDPAQLAFELHAFVQEANWAYQLLGRSDAFARARRAVAARLETAEPD
jgi:AcrR family transcriptional regulator